MSKENVNDSPDMVVYNFDQLRNVTHIMDIEGFHVGGRLYYKEICLLETKGINKYKYRLDVRLPKLSAELSKAFGRTIDFLTNSIHGMLWTNELDTTGDKSARKMYTFYGVKAALSSYFNGYEEYREPILVAYKGGNAERDLLNSIGVPSVNLEIYGCPKYNTLLRLFPKLYRMDEKEASTASLFNRPRVTFPCDAHSRRVNGELHCPVIECTVFAKWLSLTLDASDKTRPLDKTRV